MVGHRATSAKRSRCGPNCAPDLIYDFRNCFDQDQKRPRRERRMAQKLYEQLVVEGYTGSYSPVQRFVRDLKHAGAGSADAFIPLYFAAGDALQFDWSEERVVLGGVEQKLKVSHFRMCQAVNHLWLPILAKLRRWFWMHLCGLWRFRAVLRAG